MRIAIDGTALGSRRGGDETYLRMLLRGFAEIVDDGAPHIFPLLVQAGAPVPERLPGGPAFPLVHLPRSPRPLRYTVTLPRMVRRLVPRVDTLLALVHAPVPPPVPTVLYVGDLSFRHYPELYPITTRWRLNLLVPLHIRQARAVLTVSEFCKSDICRTYGVEEEKVFIAPNAIDEREVLVPSGQKEAQWSREAGINGPFFLYLGNLHPRKNVARLIDGFTMARARRPELSGYQLVIAGGRWWSDPAEDAARQRAPEGSVVSVGRVSDRQRSYLLRSAVALGYVSLFEGFGLPPLEALATGTPVLASNVTAMPEVLGDAAVLVDPTSTEAIANGLVEVATNESLRRGLITRGYEQVKRYSPRASAEAALTAFRAACPTLPDG